MPIYSTAERQTHSASFLSNSTHIRKMCFLREIRGRQSGQARSAARIHRLLSASHNCCSSLHPAPAQRILCHGGSPKGLHEFFLQSSETVSCGSCNTTSSTLRGNKREQSFLPLQVNPQSNTNPFSHLLHNLSSPSSMKLRHFWTSIS